MEITAVNSSIPIVSTAVTAINYVLSWVKILVGGLFGLYFILVILKWYEAKQLRKIMNNLNQELVELNHNINLLYSSLKPKQKRKK